VVGETPPARRIALRKSPGFAEQVGQRVFVLGVQISNANCAFSELRAVVADVGSERAGRDLSGMGQSGRPPLKRIDPGSIQGNPAGSLSGSRGRFQGDARSDDPNSMPVSVGRVFCVLLPTTRAQPVRMLGPQVPYASSQGGRRSTSPSRPTGRRPRLSSSRSSAASRSPSGPHRDEAAAA